MRRTRTVAALALALSACAARTPSVTIPPSPLAVAAALDELQRDLHMLFTAAPLVHASWGVDVFSLRTGETLFSYGADRFLLPASTQKLLTTAVAAERLG